MFNGEDSERTHKQGDMVIEMSQEDFSSNILNESERMRWKDEQTERL